MRLISTHGDGAPHRAWDRAETTDQPWSFWVPSHAPVVEASGRSWSSPFPVVALFWPDRHYQVFLLLKPSGAEYYCNVIAPPTYDPVHQSVTFIDLDLDVVVDVDGPRTVDVDEFNARQARYPNTWLTAALAAERELTCLANLREGPFSPATVARWRAWSTM